MFDVFFEIVTFSFDNIISTSFDEESGMESVVKGDGVIDGTIEF